MWMWKEKEKIGGKYNSNSTCKLIYKQKNIKKGNGKCVCSLGNREKEFIEKINKIQRFLCILKKKKGKILWSRLESKVLCVILESLNFISDNLAAIWDVYRF